MSSGTNQTNGFVLKAKGPAKRPDNVSSEEVLDDVTSLKYSFWLQRNIFQGQSVHDEITCKYEDGAKDQRCRQNAQQRDTCCTSSHQS